MAVSQADIKLLWGRAGGRCSFPNCGVELIQDSKNTVNTFTIGEQAHIVAREPSGPRGGGDLSAPERDTYANLILLCPNHHTQIDRNPDDYPVERLYFMKATHELHVQQALASSAAVAEEEVENLIYASLVDAAAECCQFSSWGIWASNLLGQNHTWDHGAPNRIMAMRTKMNAAVWPDANPELKDALYTLLTAMSGTLETYSEHSKVTSDGYEADRFYKNYGYNDNYDRDLQAYEQWEDMLVEWIYDATRAANWVADAVRNALNPAFFAIEGRFYLEVEPDMSMRWSISVPQFSGAERDSQPAAMLAKLAQLRMEHDRPLELIDAEGVNDTICGDEGM